METKWEEDKRQNHADGEKGWGCEGPAAIKMRPALKSSLKLADKCAKVWKPLGCRTRVGIRAPTACDHVEFPIR
jgi:hypothetical protein